MTATDVRSVDELIQLLKKQEKVKFLFFWGHQQRQDCKLSKSCFSQWYPAQFEIDGCIYRTAEHFMMAEKARLFGDTQALNKILAARTPGEAKKLGRGIDNFNEATWSIHRFEIVVRGNVGKFSQDSGLKEFLLATGNKILVEASPVDRIWGIGLAAKDPDIEKPQYWKGQNLLGFALMETRAKLQKN